MKSIMGRIQQTVELLGTEAAILWASDCIERLLWIDQGRGHVQLWPWAAIDFARRSANGTASKFLLETIRDEARRTLKRGYAMSRSSEIAAAHAVMGEPMWAMFHVAERMGLRHGDKGSEWIFELAAKHPGLGQLELTEV